MKCLFCNYIPYICSDDNSYFCCSCYRNYKIIVYYRFNSKGNLNQIDLYPNIGNTSDVHIVSLIQNSKETNIYDGYHILRMSIPFLININPSNFNNVINRLFKMKAFL
jgi:hypothetical protein